MIGIPVGISSSEIGLEIYAITAGIKKYKSKTKKRKKSMIKKCCQEKTKLKRIEVLISKALNMFDVIKEISVSEKEFTETICKRLQKTLAYIENKNLIDSGGGMYLTTDSLIKTNNIITIQMIFLYEKLM